MQKQKQKNRLRFNLASRFTLAVVILMAVSLVGTSLVASQSLQERIDNLRSQNEEKQEARYELEGEATSLNNKIERLESQIGSLQRQINTNQAASDKLKREIEKAEDELAKQRDLLGQNIRLMYIDGQISTIEMLASSKNLSEFVDKQQYRNAVKDKIKTTLERISELRHQLRAQQEEVQKLIDEQQLMRDELAAQRAEQNRLLSLNQNEQQTLDATMKKNAERIAELQRQQVIENARLFGGNTPAGIPGGGGYPWGNAVCLVPGPSGNCPNYDWGYPGHGIFDQWGYAYRNCTSYVAWKVASSGRHMPAGLGNAKDWPANAAARGYQVTSGGGARQGNAAVITSGQYGHVMYVEAVDGNTVYVSDYNFAGDGLYRGARPVSASSLTFVHF